MVRSCRPWRVRHGQRQSTGPIEGGGKVRLAVGGPGYVDPIPYGGDPTFFQPVAHLEESLADLLELTVAQPCRIRMRVEGEDALDDDVALVDLLVDEVDRGPEEAGAGVDGVGGGV